MDRIDAQILTELQRNARLPITDLAERTNTSPSKLLLPLSYAAILGGTLTLIGTSTNLIVSSFYEDVTGTGLGFFAFRGSRASRLID